MLTTTTGTIPVGFRITGTKTWGAELKNVIAFARDNDFAGIDLGKTGDTEGKAVLDAGLKLGSVDLPEWKDMTSPDKAARKAAIAKNIAYIETCGPRGMKNFFCVIQAADGSIPAKQSFGYAVESFAALSPALIKTDGWVVIEGCPALVSTPETYRAFFKECPERMAINYDPSHLIRMGIDPIRFLEEFVGHVKHIHGKDTEISSEGLYEFGHQIPPVLTETPRCGQGYWRYTIPGQGCMRWRRMFQVLEKAAYKGMISIELEDHYFMATDEKQKEGLLAAGRFLASC